jgi:hypothetical protein
MLNNRGVHKHALNHFITGEYKHETVPGGSKILLGEFYNVNNSQPP